MKCPTCGSDSSAVVDCRQSHSGLRHRRRRECPNGHRYTTREVIDGEVERLEMLAREPRVDTGVVSVVADQLGRMQSALARALSRQQSGKRGSS